VPIDELLLRIGSLEHDAQAPLIACEISRRFVDL
jgi:hypothetical protein